MQVQLTCPTLNVTGVSIPGAPAVIIGFNQRIAWGVTNTDADVWDHYKIKFTGKDRSHYIYGGKELETRFEADTVRVRGSEDIVFKTPYTVHGPVIVNPGDDNKTAGLPPDVAVRWTAHQPGNELLAFYKLNKARNLADYRAALTTIDCPAQNVVFADRNGNIALTANGKFAVKRQGQGKFVLNGTQPADFWDAYLPKNVVPIAINPAQGFLSSANQQSTDSSYPHYLNWEYASPDRALEINKTLGSSARHTLRSVAGLQNNTFGQLAARALPKMLALTHPDSLRPEIKEAWEMCQQWDYHYDSAQVGPSIFEEWWHQFNDTLWDELKGMHYPSRFTTLRVITEGKADAYVDNLKTPYKEDLPAILTASFIKAYEQLVHRQGAAGRQWNWGRVKRTTIQHLAKIPGLGMPFISCSGGKNVVNATASDHGPSWRMVVEMGKKPQGYGILPGGQSGNPGSPNYNHGVEKWRIGQLDALLTYDYHAAAYPGLREMLVLTP